MRFAKKPDVLTKGDRPDISGVFGKRGAGAPAKVPVAGLNLTRAALKSHRTATMPKGKKGC